MRAAGNTIWCGYSKSGGSTVQAWAGVRYTGVTIAHGATIDAATLTTERVGGVGSPTATIYGDDADNCNDFAAGERIRNLTKTSASTSFNVATGVQTHNVAAIIQEIIDRAGWASGNAVRLGVFAGTGAGGWRGVYLATDAHPTAQSPKLDITYTEAGGGAVQTQPPVGIWS